MIPILIPGTKNWSSIQSVAQKMINLKFFPMHVYFNMHVNECLRSPSQHKMTRICQSSAATCTGYWCTRVLVTGVLGKKVLGSPEVANTCEDTWSVSLLWANIMQILRFFSDLQSTLLLWKRFSCCKKSVWAIFAWPQGIIPQETIPDSCRVPFCIEFADQEADHDDGGDWLGQGGQSRLIRVSKIDDKMRKGETSLGQAKGPPLSPEHAEMPFGENNFSLE